MIDTILKNLPWVWFGLAVIFAAIEAFTLTLCTIWFAAAAILMAFLAFTPIPLLAQILIFLIISIILLILFRKTALNYINSKKQATNVDALCGKTALVVKDIKKFEKGEIKINGVIWNAACKNSEELTKDSECRIIHIEGTTAIVEPVKR